jgi:hypothetical protein
MKDTIDRRAAVRVLASVPAWEVPVVAMATSVDPIFTAIERDRIAYVALAASLNRTDDGKAHRKMAANSRKPTRMLTKPPAASGGMLLVNRRMTSDGCRRSPLPLCGSV